MAAPEEIQVYLDEFTDVGKYALDLHTNYVDSGQLPSDHQFRTTPELSYGINNNWDMGAYWLTVANPGALPRTDGMKIRAKWRPQAPSPDSPFYWAVGFEGGQLAKSFYPDESSGEVKLIGVWKTDAWTIGANFNYDRALKSNPIHPATTELDSKIAYQIKDGLQLGVENYAFFGAINNGDPFQPQNNEATYLVADLGLGKWDLNVGIGHASGQTSDNTILKAIIGVPL